MPRAKERFPSNAAVSSSPFLDVLVGSISWQNRVSEFLNVGVQAGMYVAGRVRLTVNVILPTSPLSDQYYSAYYDYSSNTDYYYRQPSKSASLFYGASLGIVAVGTASFVMAPGVAFSRTDVSDYGSTFGVSLPFEWVTATGLRLGLELDVGRAFGGSAHLQCMTNTGLSGTCGAAVISQDRPTGTSVALQFQIGFGFNHPDPLPPEPSQNVAPYGWPAVPAAPRAPVAPAALPAPAAPAAPSVAPASPLG